MSAWRSSFYVYLNARPRDRLKAHCKFGRLFDAQRLLKEEGAARLRKTRKWTPLFVAVDRGFLSLVEVLLRYDHAQWDLEKSYRGALRRRRPDLAGLILRAPSWSDPIDPVEALAAGDLTLARMLHEAGTDFTTGQAILHGAIRNAYGVVEIVEYLGIRDESVDDQLHSAMATHAYLGHVSSVMRLLRAGLDPHRVVPHLDEDGRRDYEGSAVECALYTNKPGFLAALKPHPQKDNPEHLIKTVVFLGEDKMLQILLDAGFELNCKANGGSPALDELLRGGTLAHHLPLAPLGHKGAKPRYREDQARSLLAAVQSFVNQGSKWVPDLSDRNELRYVRDVLLALGEEHALELLNMLETSGAANRERVAVLLRTARMKELFRAAKRKQK